MLWLLQEWTCTAHEATYYRKQTFEHNIQKSHGLPISHTWVFKARCRLFFWIVKALKGPIPSPYLIRCSLSLYRIWKPKGSLRGPLIQPNFAGEGRWHRGVAWPCKAEKRVRSSTKTRTRLWLPRPTCLALVQRFSNRGVHGTLRSPMLARRVQQTGFQHHQRLGPGSLLLPTFYIGVFSKISLGKKKKKKTPPSGRNLDTTSLPLTVVFYKTNSRWSWFLP